MYWNSYLTSKLMCEKHWSKFSYVMKLLNRICSGINLKLIFLWSYFVIIIYFEVLWATFLEINASMAFFEIVVDNFSVFLFFPIHSKTSQESILPNFFLRKTKIFPVFSIKLGHFIAHTLFPYATSTQA